MPFLRRARFAPVTVAVALAMGQLLAVPQPGRALGGTSDDDGTRSSADIRGSLCTFDGEQCGDFQHDSPDGVRTYSATDERSAGGDRAQADIRFDETYDANGTIRSITISGHLTASNSGGG